MIRRLLRRLLPDRYAEGGTLPPPAACGEPLIVMSPGWTQLPDGTVHRYPDDILRAMNQPRPKRRRP